MRSRRGFTLVELLVGMGAALSVLFGLWAICSTSERSRAASDGKLQGVRAALLFDEPLERDLASLWVDDQHPLQTAAADGGPGLRFNVVDGERSRPDQGVIALRSIEYRFDGAACALTRSLDGASPVRLPGAYDRVAFALDQAGVLTYLASCIPAELVSRPARRRPADRTVLCGTLSLPAVAGPDSHPWWLPAPTTQASAR